MMNNENNLFLTIIYQGITKKVNFTDEEYICLNDLAKFFPQKRLDHWLSNSSTRDFISVVENQLNMNYDTRNIGYHKSAIFTIKGKGKKQGTYAHELVALEFLSWLSPEFKVLVFSQWNTWRKQQATPQQTNILTLDALQEMMKGWMKKMTDRLATKKALNVLDNELTDAMLDFAKTLNIIHEDIYDRMSKQDKQINLLQVQIRHLLKTHGFAYLYVLYNPTRKEYKIGHSQSPYQRQRLFQSLDPDISLVLMIALESAHQARTLEKLLHYHFQDKNTHGEWFDLNEDDIDFIRLFELLAVAS